MNTKGPIANGGPESQSTTANADDAAESHLMEAGSSDGCLVATSDAGRSVAVVFSLNGGAHVRGMIDIPVKYQPNRGPATRFTFPDAC